MGVKMEKANNYWDAKAIAIGPQPLRDDNGVLLKYEWQMIEVTRKGKVKVEYLYRVQSNGIWEVVAIITRHKVLGGAEWHVTHCMEGV